MSAAGGSAATVAVRLTVRARTRPREPGPDRSRYSRGMLDRLFSPLAIGSVTIPNRIVSTSHQTSLVHDHLPTDELIAYHGPAPAAAPG